MKNDIISFNSFLNEQGEIPFEKSTHHGFWQDNDHVEVFHGTHKRNIPSIRKNGLNHPDPNTGMHSVTLDPHTAHGYAAMSGSGGESNFRSAGAKVVNTPHEDRAVAKFKIPKKWLEKHMDKSFSGNVGQARENIQSKEKYENWKKANPNKSDHEYYATTEFRLKKASPSRFYVGHAQKVKS